MIKTLILASALSGAALAEAASQRWQLGIDYIQLVPAQPVAVAPGKIELKIRRYYLDDAMDPFEQALSRWLKTAPSDVQVVYARGIQTPVEFLTARMDLTLRA